MKYLKYTGGSQGNHPGFIDYGFIWKIGDVQEVEDNVAAAAEKTFPSLFTIVPKPSAKTAAPEKLPDPPKVPELTEAEKKKLNEQKDKALPKDSRKDKGFS